VQAKSFHDELQDTLQQLSEIDAQLVTSQPVGGLPETARKQLEQLQVSNVFRLIQLLRFLNIFWEVLSLLLCTNTVQQN